VTEDWGAANLYCANCDSDELNRLKHNTPSIDFDCPKCKALFQLKGRKSPIGGTLTDAAYGKMREAILSGNFQTFWHFIMIRTLGKSETSH
jgi:hypothetical protein